MMMKLKATKCSFAGCPKDMMTPGFSENSIIHIQIGLEYESYAFSVFSGVVFMLIVDDLGMFSWLPLWLFELIESAVPADWILGNYQPELLVVGPRVIAGSLEAYTRFVEQDPEMVDFMHEYIEASCKNKASGQ